MGRAEITLLSLPLPQKIVRLEAALDSRIAKLLARLVGLKEFKRTPDRWVADDHCRNVDAAASAAASLAAARRKRGQSVEY